MTAKTEKMKNNDLGRIKEFFRKNGVKVTHQRLEIYREIMKAEDHPSAEDIYRRIRPRLPTVSLDTVYRTLDMFEKLGIISRVEVLDDRARFDPHQEPHHHLVCTVCKRILDFSWPEMDSLKPPIPTDEWGRVVSSHLELRGICRECSKKISGNNGPVASL